MASKLPCREVVVSPAQFQRVQEMVAASAGLYHPDEISRRVLQDLGIDVGAVPTPTEYRFVVDWTQR